MTDVFEVSPEMQAAWCAFEPIGQFSETMSFARFNGMLRHAFLSGYMATSGMSAGTAKTPQAVEGEARQPGPEGETPKPLFSKDSPMTEQRARENTEHARQRVNMVATGHKIESVYGPEWTLGAGAQFRADLQTVLSTPFASGGEKYRLMLLDLLAVIHRDGGHRTQELGIKLSYEQALQLSSERIAALDELRRLSTPFAESAKSPSDSVSEALERAAGRLSWCSTANPGCASETGRKLAAEWADEARAALQSSEADNG